MRFLLDENIEYRLALYLNQHDHNATAIAHDYPRSLPDREVLAIAAREQRILITDDRDYGELIFRRLQAHAGVIYFRLPDATVSEKIQRVDQLLITHQGQLDQFIVVTRRSIRVRHRHTN
jgi:predicted nuclease of predicted toxin-antitoxin system